MHYKSATKTDTVEIKKQNTLGQARLTKAGCKISMKWK